MYKEVVIVSAKRTPMGSFLGTLSEISATKLGSIAIEAVINDTCIDKNEIQEVFMGCVLQAGLGQAPARQAALGAGLNESTPATTVNKVCASGMKAVSLAAQAIQCGDIDVAIAGGMENMSSVPFYSPNMREGNKFGNVQLMDGLVKDGLLDVYNNFVMGNCAESCATEHGFSREDQDNFAIQSYERADAAWKNGYFNQEVIAVNVPQRKGDPVKFYQDEEYRNVNFDKLPKLKPVFQKDGTVTAANASTLNDGASALLLMSAEKAKALGMKPIARILSIADAATKPTDFTVAPALALPMALKKAGKSLNEIDLFEINEAFSVVALANMKLLNLSVDKVNIHGGAVALGHPLGNSGSRIFVTLIHALKQHGKKLGAAGICNGGGGASAMVVEAI